MGLNENGRPVGDEDERIGSCGARSGTAAGEQRAAAASAGKLRGTDLRGRKEGRKEKRKGYAEWSEAQPLALVPASDHR